MYNLHIIENKINIKSNNHMFKISSNKIKMFMILKYFLLYGYRTYQYSVVTNEKINCNSSFMVLK